MIEKFTQLIIDSAKKGHSDVHICGGHPSIFRKDGQIHFSQTGRWTHPDVEALVSAILNPRQVHVLRRRWSVDFAQSIGNIRVRINVFNTDQGPSLAIRLLPGSVPGIEQLNLHPSLLEIAALKSGLILVCGTTGCGKTTTIAAILDHINKTRAVHIVTLEDPIEYRIASDKSFVEQREVESHVPSVDRGLIDILRADPDVIMVGELRDPETIALTLNAAESGHLVIATLHATNMEDAIYRIMNSAPPEAEDYVRYQLASTLSWVIIQKLIWHDKARCRVPVLSIMRGSQQIKGMIRERKLHQIDNALHTGKVDGLFTQDRYIKEYLDTRESYHNPNRNFTPSAEAVKAGSYQSTLFDPIRDDHGLQRAKHERKTDATKGMDMPVAPHIDGSSDDSRYVIVDGADLWETVAQTQKEWDRKE